MEENDEDIWGRDEYCNACRMKCADEVEKQNHRNSQIHIKKWNLHKFFTQDSVNHGAIGVSEMLERYKLRKLPVIGLHQCQEIQQVGFSNHDKANFWTCNICYEAGATYQSADDHLNSMNHIRNYMDECECDEKEEIEKECENDECNKYERYCVAAQQIFEREGGVEGLQPPSILRMNFSTEDGKKRLGIDDVSDVSFQACPGDDAHKILYCSTCNEVAPVHIVGKYTAERARANHLELPTHQRYARILAIINEFKPEEIYEEFNSSEDTKWIEKNPDQWYLSQPCGFRYSIRAGEETMCTVCYALVNSDNVTEHFSSEYHTMKYLSMIKPHSTYVAQQLSGSERRAKALTTLLSAYSLETDTVKVVTTLSRFPTAIKQELSGDFHVYPDAEIATIDDFKETTGKIYRFCPSCSTFIEFDANTVDTPKRMSAAWKSHVLSTDHFDTAAIRTRSHFDLQYLVPYSPTISNAETDIKGVWKVDNKNVLIQTQCDVGLEFMVEDDQANEVTCQCCWKVLSKNPALVNQHVRSYDHLKQYIFACAPDNVRILLGPEVDEHKKEFMMDFLSRQSGLFPKRMNLYSKKKTLDLASWTPVSRSFIQMSMTMENFDRDCFDTINDLVDKVASDGGDKISAKEALLYTRMVIINTTRGADKELGSVVCRCEDCGLLVIVDAATWQKDIFDSHLCTKEHRDRTEVRKKHIVNAYGIRHERSSYIVKPYVQKAENKKVVWQWNDSTKKHEYVHGLVGLEDIIDCCVPDDRNIEGIETKTEFYCTLCATVLQKRGDELALHMREMSHCVNWVHKHRPSHIREMFTLMTNNTDKGKEFRKFLQGLLKDVHPPPGYCMLAYDPDGVEKDRQNEIKQRIQAEEKRKKMEAGREKALAEKERKRLEREERDKKMEEQRLLARQKLLEDEQRHLEKAKAKQAENAARLEYAQRNVHKYRQQTPEEIAYNKRLNVNSMLEQQKCAERESIDLQKAKLEAERRKLLSASGMTQSSAPNGPKLVVFPQLKSQPNVAHNPYGTSMPAAPPGINLPPDAARFNMPQASQMQQPPPQSFFGPPPPATFQQNLPPPTLPRTFPLFTQREQDLPAYVKRPSLRGQLVDPVIHDATKIKNKADLLEHMHSQGAISIVDQSELPHELSQKIQDHPDTFGVAYVTEIVCLDDPSLDSYLCTICHDWTDPSGMIKHLSSVEHKTKFLHFKYRTYYDEVMREENPVIRKSIFKNFISDLKKKHVGEVINLRMRTLLDKATIGRLWPGYEEYFNRKAPTQAWSSGGFKPVAGPSIVLPDAVKVPALIDSDDMEIDQKEVPKRKHDVRERRRSRSRSYSRDRSRRSRSRENRRRRSRTRSRSRSYDRYHRSRRDRRSRSRTRSRSRSRSRSRDRHQSRSSRSRQNTWADQTDSFLAKLGDGKSSSGAKGPSYQPNAQTTQPMPPQVAQSQVKQMTDFNSKLSTVRALAQSGVIRGSQIDALSVTNTPPPSVPIVPTHSADIRVLETRRKEEETSRTQKIMGVLLDLEELIAKYGDNVPRVLVLDIYGRFGFNELEGDRAVEEFVKTNKQEKIIPRQSTSSISDVISSYGIGAKSNSNHQYVQSTIVQTQPQQLQHSQPQYGIPSQEPPKSVYSQFFGSQTLPQTKATGQNAALSFYSDPPTSINTSAVKTNTNEKEHSDDDSDDDEYQDVYQLIRPNLSQKSNSDQKTQSNQMATEAEKLPGQKIPLKRTILPSGELVNQQSATVSQVPAATASPAPSDSSSVVIVTPSSATATPVKSLPQVPPAPSTGRPLANPSLGMPAPIAVKVVQQPSQHQPQQMIYQTAEQGYPPMNPGAPQYQQQYPQQMYAQPQQPQQQSLYAQQYGIQHPVYQQQPPQQNGYPPQYVQQQQQHQFPPQYPPAQPQQYPLQPPQQQQYYQQNPQMQQPPNNGTSAYGINGNQQQHYWPPQ